MADVTIDMDDRSLDEAADRLDDASTSVEAGGSLSVALENLDPREAIGFVEGALDAGYEVAITAIETDLSRHGSVIEMIRDEAEVVHIERFTAEVGV
jgi:hypothetical protein